MKNRRKRLQEIISILSEKNISSQAELLKELENRGISITQGSLSRDFKTLRMVKVPTENGTSVYVVPDVDTLKEKLLMTGSVPQHADFKTGVISIRFSGNMAVIKTRNGYASGVAYDIDSHKSEEILGTIPGSDTIFAVLREGVDHETAKEIFMNILQVKPEVF